MTQSDTNLSAAALPEGETLTSPPTPEPEVSAVEFAPLLQAASGAAGSSLEILDDVTIEISVELGRAQMAVGDVLGLKVGSVVELEKVAGESGDVYVNGTLVGRGEIVVVNDRFGIRIFDVVAHPRSASWVG